MPVVPAVPSPPAPPADVPAAPLAMFPAVPVTTLPAAPLAEVPAAPLTMLPAAPLATFPAAPFPAWPIPTSRAAPQLELVRSLAAEKEKSHPVLPTLPRRGPAELETGPDAAGRRPRHSDMLGTQQGHGIPGSYSRIRAEGSRVNCANQPVAGRKRCGRAALKLAFGDIRSGAAGP